MKNIIFYSVLLVGSMTVSCAKEYTCDCEIEHKETAQGYSYSYSFDNSQTIKSKEKSATSACADLDYKEKTTNNGVNYEITQDCKLK